MPTPPQRSGADLALMLLAGFRTLADAGSVELTARGYPRIRPIHDFALHAIAGGDDTAAALARTLGITKQAVAKTLAFLEAEGYVTGAPDERDTRRRRFTITRRGHALMRTGQEVFDDLRDRWARRIGAKELARLEEALAELTSDAQGGLDAAGWFTGS